MSFTTASHETDGVAVFELQGRITLGAGSEALRDLIREQVNSGQKKIVLNLGGIAYMDSSGLGELVTGMKAVRQSGGDLKLLNLTKKINDILQITRLYSVFDIYKDETQALASFRA
jgi:anti-sigma B factor antagonist